MHAQPRALARRRRRFSRAGALAPVFLGLCFASGCDRQAATPQVPQGPLNVVLVTIDTLRADALGAYGQELPTSPNLDALAAEGVLFEQCGASVPSTLPSHASIMTGKQPYAHGVRDNAGYALNAGNVTLAEVLRARGYRTGAEVAAPVLGRRTLMNQGFDHYRDLESFDAVRIVVDVNGVPKRLPERAATDVTDRGIGFLESAAGGPFFLWLHYFDPHVFYSPPPAYQALIPQSPYHGEVRYVDAELARVVQTLRHLERDDRTLLVVTSDHGEGLDEHDESTHSYFVYETTMRVPLIFWGPGVISTPRRVSELVRSVDVTPTILDLLGEPPLPGVQGVSLAPLIDGREESLGLSSYGESMLSLVTFGASMLRSMRDGDWKYIHKVRPELYDLRADPSELENLAARHPERIASLREKLRAVVGAAPAPDESAYTEVDPTTRAHLEALGYVATGARPEQDEIASLEVSGVDPSTLAPDIELLSAAHGYRKAGHLEKAEQIFRDLHERHPRSLAALSGLIGTLRRMERTEELPDLLRKGIALGRATGADYHVDLARFVAEEGDYDEAERLIAEAIELQPCSVVAWVSLSNLLHARGEYARQLEALETAVSSCPAATDLQNDLAYALATTPDDELRDGPRALELARAAVSQGRGNPAYLDTLACALAETGDTAAAARTASRALRLLETRGAYEDFVREIQAHRAAFEAGRPVRN
jgi:arylsulfatase A-like enzyme/predicted Zn-dependent protease